MKLPLALLAILLLAQCKTGSKLPPPGEPVSKDLDERWQLRERERAEAASEAEATYPDPEDQKAYEAGYAAGYVDQQRRRPSDPEPHMTGLASPQRSAFITGYTAGFAR